MPESPFFSIIIPTLNEKNFISPLLEALKNQNEKDFEVIFVDANSTDNTVGLIKNFSINNKVTVLPTSARNVSLSRNFGAEKSKGKFLVFIDADNSIPPNFLSIARRYVENGKYNVAIPKLTPSNNRFFDRALYTVNNLIIFSMLPTPRPFSVGSTMVVKKASFDEVKGFDPSLFIAEDHDIIRRLKKKKNKIKFMFDTFAVFSTRRFDQHGAKTYGKFFYASLYLLFFSKIKNPIYKYEMGGNNFSDERKKMV